MAARLLAVAGLNLDKPWPDESSGVGPRLRAASSELLLELAQRALDLKVDALVVHGGLWDTATVRSSTVDEVLAVFSAVTIPVIVIPDRVEADSHRPQRVLDWPPTVHWLAGDEKSLLDIGTERFLAIGANSYAAVAEHGAAWALTSDGQTSGLAIPAVRRQPASTLGTPQPGAPDDLDSGLPHGEDIGVPDLVPSSGSGRPRGLVVTVGVGAAPATEDVLFTPDLGTIKDLDIGEHTENDSLVNALDSLIATCSAMDRVRVSGRVGPHVLVPPLLRWTQQRSDVTVVWEDLEHVFPQQSSDRTVQAELIRRLSGPGPDVARRHQALAVALASLNSAEASA